MRSVAVGVEILKNHRYGQFSKAFPMFTFCKDKGKNKN